MAPWGLPGSAVLSAAVFVGGAVSSLLVAPGECVVPAGTPGAAESGLHAEGSEGHGGSGLVEPAALPRLELLASCSATESGSEHLGVPGWPGQGAARGAARVPPHPLAGLPPSFPRLFWTAGSQPGVFRVSPCRGAISPAACPGCPAEDPFLPSGSSEASPVEDLDTRERVLPCRCFPRSPIFFFIMLKP